jgi:very-short-patch-repair endonuclease
MNKQISKELRNQLIESARYLRSNPTASESRLWEHLRKEQLRGYKFRRQHIIRVFIVDFYSPSSKLIIEIDGPIHRSQKEQDAERDRALQTLGYRVLRFTNDQVDNELETVLKIISSYLGS